MTSVASMANTEKKLLNLFKACHSTPSKTKTKKTKRGGSYASDAVNADLDDNSFERINFLLSGGSSGIPMSLAVADANSGILGQLSASMQTSMAQPLMTQTTFHNNFTQPVAMANIFHPFLTNATLN